MWTIVAAALRQSASVCRRAALDEVTVLARPIAGHTSADDAVRRCASLTERFVRASAPWAHRLDRGHPGNTCLVRAVAVVRATRELGYATELKFGAKRDAMRGNEAAGVAAHAWAELGGEPLTDAGRDFVVLASVDAIAT